jgi:hypothetical protein
MFGFFAKTGLEPINGFGASTGLTSGTFGTGAAMTGYVSSMFFRGGVTDFVGVLSAESTFE